MHAKLFVEFLVDLLEHVREEKRAHTLLTFMAVKFGIQSKEYHRTSLFLSDQQSCFVKLEINAMFGSKVCEKTLIIRKLH
jgi:hypothetical protein